MRRICCLAITAIALSLALTANAVAGQATLGSGKTVEILSMGPMMFGDGQKALMLKYQTALPIDDVVALRKEADEVWDRFVVDVEKAGYDQAIISANEPAQGTLVTHNKSYNFIYEKKDGSWRTLEASGREKTKLDQMTIKDFMDRLDWLHDNNEMNSFLLYFANDWVGSLASPQGQVTVNRAQLAQETHEALTETKNYHHRRDIVETNVAPDGMSAKIDSHESEDGIVDGKDSKMECISVDFIEVRGGHIVFTKSSSKENK